MNINAPTFMLDTVVGAASGKKLSLRDWLAQWACDANRIVYVGTDSQQSAGVTKFTTAIVSYEPGSGFPFPEGEVPEALPSSAGPLVPLTAQLLGC